MMLEEYDLMWIVYKIGSICNNDSDLVGIFYIDLIRSCINNIECWLF